MARSGSQERRVSRKRRLGQGIALGALALGVPALTNALIARRAAKLPPTATPDLEGWTEDTWDSPIGPIRVFRLDRRDASSSSADDQSAIPSLFLHSLGPGHSSTQWLKAAAVVAEVKPVVLLDLPGWGDSVRGNLDYGLALSVDLLHAFASDVINGEFDLVASGESATIALSFAEGSPEVRTLALSGPAGLRVAGENSSVTDKGMDMLLAAPVFSTSAVNAYTSRSAIENNLVRHQSAPPSGDQVDQHYRLAHLRGSERSLAAFLRGRYERPLDSLKLPERTPLFIGWGRNAVGEPIEDADLWLNSLPQAELAVFEHSASWPHVDQPDDFATELLRFQSVS